MPTRGPTDEDFFNALQASPADFKPAPDVSAPRPAVPAPVLQAIEPEPEVEPTPVLEESTIDPETDDQPTDPDRSGWTLPMLFAGIGIIACCLLIPAADDIRRTVYEREKLRADLAQLQSQIEINQEFLNRIINDPALAERLAQRQMRMVRQGTAVLELKNDVGLVGMSPYEIVAIPPPAPMPPYKPVAGKFADLCRNPRSQLFLMGIGLMLAAAGLVLGGSAGKPVQQDNG